MDHPRTATASTLRTLKKWTELYRVHDKRFEGNGFNRCMGDETRFTHLRNESGKCIPTSYAATSLDGAAFETVFRGIPDKYQAVTRQSLDDRMISVVLPERDLKLVGLFTPELKAWDLDQAEVFAPRSDVYKFCRELAARCWRDNPTADGLIWSSVQDSSARATLLFGDRLRGEDLTVESSRCVGSDPSALDDLNNAGKRAGYFISK